MFEWVLNELNSCTNLKLVWKSFDLYQDFNLVEDPKIKEMPLPMVTFQTKFEKIFLQQNTTIKALILCPHR